MTDQVSQDHAGLLDARERAVSVALTGDDDGTRVAPQGTFRKIGMAIVTLIICVAATYFVPQLRSARPWVRESAQRAWLQGDREDPVPFWNVIGRELLGEGTQNEEQVLEEQSREFIASVALGQDDQAAVPLPDREIIAPGSVEAVPPYRPHADDEQQVLQPIETASQEALDGFFARLARTDTGYAGAVTRVLQWGDSAIAADHVTSTLRAKMQSRFGDAGHGFHLIAKPNASYSHKGLVFSGGDDWSRCYIINHCRTDGFYGLGGTTVWSAGGARSRFSTSSSTANGQKISHLELWYLAGPSGGDVSVRVDDQDPVVVHTASGAEQDAWYDVPMEDGPHHIDVRAAGGGRVRLFGVVAERDVPGVVVDAMEQLGAFTSRMLYFDPAHLRRQIDHRDPALLVFMFGGNDLLLSPRRLPEYAETFREVLRRFRGERSPIDCLVMSPVDHGIRAGGRILSNPMVARITEVQREVALASGCAFFNSQAAMGGDGSVSRWRHATPPRISGDLAHLTDAGQKVLGHMVYIALMHRYAQYRRRTPSP